MAIKTKIAYVCVRLRVVSKPSDLILPRKIACTLPTRASSMPKNSKTFDLFSIFFFEFNVHFRVGLLLLFFCCELLELPNMTKICMHVAYLSIFDVIKFQFFPFFCFFSNLLFIEMYCSHVVKTGLTQSQGRKMTGFGSSGCTLFGFRVEERKLNSTKN